MNSHDRFEEELKIALRREEAPPGFAQRVIARAVSGADRESLWDRVWALVNTRALHFATAVIVLIAITAGVLEHQRRERERREGEAAKQQLMLALRITSQKLQYVQAKMNHAGPRQNAHPAQEQQ